MNSNRSIPSVARLPNPVPHFTSLFFALSRQLGSTMDTDTIVFRIHDSLGQALDGMPAISKAVRSICKLESFRGRGRRSSKQRPLDQTAISWRLSFASYCPVLWAEDGEAQRRLLQLRQPWARRSPFASKRAFSPSER